MGVSFPRFSRVPTLFAEMHLKDKANSDTGSDGPLISRVDLV